jgi:hypothetical protein
VASNERGILSSVSNSTLASVFSTVGLGTLRVRNTDSPRTFWLKNSGYLVRSFLTTNPSTSLPSASHICSSHPRWEKA